MFARVTHYKMKPGSKEAATAKMESLKDRILAMPGLHNFTSVMNEDGSGYVIALVQDEETSNANAETVKALWGEFAEFLEEVPTPEGFDVLVNWSN